MYKKNVGKPHCRIILTKSLIFFFQNAGVWYKMEIFISLHLITHGLFSVQHLGSDGIAPECFCTFSL
jgi:hypothetical protein